jgi:hypothetical protein
MDTIIIDMTAHTAHVPRMAQMARKWVRIWVRRRYRKASEALEQNDTMM